MIEGQYTGGATVTEEDGRVQLVTLYARVLLHLTDNPRVSQETLARHMNVTMRTVQRHLTELEEEGYVSVDRDKKPFEYTIDWTKPWPHVEWLKVVLFHPEVRKGLRALSDVAVTTYTKAQADGSDPSAALQGVFASAPDGAVVA